jgi:hypothetical protein
MFWIGVAEIGGGTLSANTLKWINTCQDPTLAILQDKIFWQELYMSKLIFVELLLSH